MQQSSWMPAAKTLPTVVSLILGDRLYSNYINLNLTKHYTLYDLILVLSIPLVADKYYSDLVNLCYMNATNVSW